MSNQKSSLEWYSNEILKISADAFRYKISGREFTMLHKKALEQAKAMEKEQHGKTWDASMDNYIARGENYVRAYVDFEDYYAETFGGNDDQQ
jgi:hypothetical protein